MAITLQDYLTSLQGKRVAVIGIGVSNTPLIKTLLQAGISVTACDKAPRTAFGALADELESMGAVLHLGDAYLDGLDQDVIFRSPGIRPDIPPFLSAMEKGSALTSEMEVFFDLCPCPIIAVITNLSTNNLDIHKSMEEYALAKENIFSHQGENDLAIFNRDNDLTHAMVCRAPGRVLQFSRRTSLEEGVFVDNGTIVVAQNGKKRTLFSTDRILIPGEHNVENYLAAIAAVQGLVPDDVILHTAETFPGVEHRIELVRTLHGVRYYNDSIASSPTRTIAGLRSFPQKVILIAGGYDKKIPFDVLGQAVQDHVKTLILTGHTADKIRQAVLSSQGYQKGQPTIVMEEDFSQAVLTASRMAEDGDVVLLSPACASFDHFKNFAQRGQTFKAIVNGL